MLILVVVYVYCDLKKKKCWYEQLVWNQISDPLEC